MTRALLLLVALCTGASGITLEDALSRRGVVTTLHGDGRTELRVTVSNAAAEAISVEVPAGFVAVSESWAQLATIRSVTLEVPAGQTAEATIPAVPLSLKNVAQAESYRSTPTQKPALRPLLDYSAKHNDLPRPTAQLVALLLLENPTDAAWRQFLGHDPSAQDVATAVDALSIARQLRPEGTFALAQDADFRLRAVRQPLVRGKAMQLFGMAAPEGVPVPDVNQLLHTRPGDNCPICRMRAQMEKAGNGL